ncbi:16S rRNA (cytidine(1402)-2'-O)-methyltransferase [Acidiluteibacter ferrifornacis]|jgi:16S rRNA (cytidine1402-2'-O)-methyltransferase|uniref:Ribosomal RNA small subunit methyltransferase I n=1 Tax=Acidiluteibacter ferrifornacis TaxID=2692424 RepID=A0A6N9NFT8_9FLAO|nr:16S rRNA (cytidine(1402)-2'-O)-methyltransferase [Acidiluteibacter ferrifornacis]MBR9830663.1 16S rRNA (cytidine(1402)-2'-O)-methyltransferase [bacterium]NBG64679.1 16S rRNA (cytidine(1402)-2'-O)-methyltransferase [Acidiluteibacter ferrifornacis]
MGKLYLVPTPIGNLEDMTYRSVRILNEVDAILCEDTRTSSRLLQHYGIQKRLISHHQHNEHKAVEKVIEHLQNGETIALITDAGTPGISDPGFLLTRACAEADIEVETLPGATAFVPALVNSGLPCDKFCFEGFLPHKKGRHTRLTQLAEEERTIVFYESTHRIVKSLSQMAEYFGAERKASVSRELTKMHEETVRGTLTELAQYYTDHISKGEFVVVVGGKE